MGSAILSRWNVKEKYLSVSGTLTRIVNRECCEEWTKQGQLQSNYQKQDY